MNAKFHAISVNLHFDEIKFERVKGETVIMFREKGKDLISFSTSSSPLATVSIVGLDGTLNVDVNT